MSFDNMPIMHFGEPPKQSPIKRERCSSSSLAFGRKQRQEPKYPLPPVLGVLIPILKARNARRRQILDLDPGPCSAPRNRGARAASEPIPSDPVCRHARRWPCLLACDGSTQG